MSIGYVLKRVGMFFLIIWLAATINFFLPRLGGQDPIAEMLVQQAAMGGSIQTGLQGMIEIYNEKFGLNTPSLAAILELPRGHESPRLQLLDQPTIHSASSTSSAGLCPGHSVLLIDDDHLLLGPRTLLGAFMAWPRAPKFLSFLMPPLLSLNAIPFFLLGLVLIYLFAFRMRLFPLSGGYTAGHVSRLYARHFSKTRSIIRSSRRSRSSSSRSAAGRWACAP